MANLRQAELARLAGVSQSTVSRCLRNDANQNAETRERVLRLAREMGYVPNSFAAGLAHARGMENKSFRATVALIAGNQDCDPVKTWQAWRMCYEAAREQAERHGYALEYFWRYAPGMSGARLRQIIEARGIRGVVLMMIDAGELDLPWEKLAMGSVCIADSWRMRGHYVGFNRYTQSLMALEAFGELGYRRPALAVQSRAELEYDRGAHVGALYLYQQRLAAQDRLPVFVGRAEDFPKWYKAHRPDIVFGFSDEVVREIREQIPAEVGFLCLSGRDHGELADCSFLDPRTDLAGVAVLDLVTAQLERNERGWPAYPNSTLVPSEIHFGATTRDLRGAERAKRRQRGKQGG